MDQSVGAKAKAPARRHVMILILDHVQHYSMGKSAFETDIYIYI